MLEELQVAPLATSCPHGSGGASVVSRQRVELLRPSRPRQVLLSAARSQPMVLPTTALCDVGVAVLAIIEPSEGAVAGLSEMSAALELLCALASMDAPTSALVEGGVLEVRAALSRDHFVLRA